MSEGAEGSMATASHFEFGQRVRHLKKPEWGIGVIVKTEDTASGGKRAQRVTVRFPNSGLKTLNTSHAQLQLVKEEAEADLSYSTPTVADLDRMNQSGWLTPVAERKISEIMTSLPMAVRDPFIGLPKRLAATLDLYRFERHGRSLIDWAVAQTGLADPLTRFSRHELEMHFDRWAAERDNHLQRLLQEVRTEPAVLNGLLDSAPPAGREAVRRLIALR
ncbi:MAG: DUF3553 domain-containing protein [Phycisphaerales bacterium]|nr:MAG: DUF3553 domain-containing protein [Phycisphaerales bacterium]